MDYYQTCSYTYSFQSGWDYNVQAGPSTPPYTLGNTYSEGPSLFGSPIHANPYDIPISRYSTLAGALTPVNPAPREVGAHLLLGRAPQQVHGPQLVVPPCQGARAMPVAPQPEPKNRRRTAYVYAPPPPRHRRKSAGTTKFCRVNGCEFSTKKEGKVLSRHRATHFPGLVGTACPGCGKIFSRSSTCGTHLKKCNPQLWEMIAATKGTQDSWGKRVGQGLVRASLTGSS